MSSFQVLIFLVCFSSTTVYSFSRDVIARGKWIVYSANKCPDSEKYAYEFSLTKKKFNRTLDVFDVTANVPEDITENNLGIYVESCIKVDGGCKLIYTEKNPSLCDFLNMYAPKNIKRALNSIGIDTCRIPKGYNEVLNFFLDFDELPEHGMLGEFRSTGFFIKDEETVGCVMLDVSFKPMY